MPTYRSVPPYEHGLPETLGVLVVNLGTPEAPTTSAVRRYLAEFLSDPRVVELPRPLWWLALHGVILRTRPSRSADAYRQIWTEQGSPLLLHTEAIAAGIQARISSRLSGHVNVAVGMSYGSPSISLALDSLHQAGARRILTLPLYPQYSGTTTGSVFDAVTRTLARRRWVPEFRFINHYHDAPGYIAALASGIRHYWDRNGRGNRLLFSFHGVPRKTLLDGDPYHCQCRATARLVAESLDLGDRDWTVAFQSRVGRDEWLRPYADDAIAELGRGGLDKLDVVCPGFAADCLETLEEIEIRYTDLYKSSGGGELRYIPALNAGDDHVAFLSRLIEKNVSGWPEASPDWSDSSRSRDRSRERAIAMGAQR